MTAAELHKRDDRKRWVYGRYRGGSWVSPEFPNRIPKEWKTCLDLIAKRKQLNFATLHIYDVVELMVEARKDCQR